MKSREDARKCPLCHMGLAIGSLYEYVECQSCGSYIYVSDRTAEDDNRRFFNSAYSCSELQRYSAVKKKLFRTYAKKDEKINHKEYSKLSQLRQEITDIIVEGKTSMEIGFGEGRYLLKCLESGVDAYGVDISEEAVAAFCRKHPQCRDRVRVGTRFGKEVGTVYCSALFEHLDDPQEFIDGLSPCLTPGGFLIIDAIPVVNESQSNIGIHEDISFWKPCHRVVASHSGLEHMFGSKGYTLTDCASLDLFNYKLLSLHIRDGYEDIITIRHSCVKSRKLPGIRRYFDLCREALNVQSSALVGTYIFRRQ